MALSPHGIEQVFTATDVEQLNNEYAGHVQIMKQSFPDFIVVPNYVSVNQEINSRLFVVTISFELYENIEHFEIAASERYNEGVQMFRAEGFNSSTEINKRLMEIAQDQITEAQKKRSMFDNYHATYQGEDCSVYYTNRSYHPYVLIITRQAPLSELLGLV